VLARVVSDLAAMGWRICLALVVGTAAFVYGLLSVTVGG